MLKKLAIILLASLIAIGLGARDLRLNWPSNDSPYVTGYKLVYGTNVNSLNNTVSTGGLTFTVSNLLDRTDYYFAVIASFGSNDAAPSGIMANLFYSFPPGYSIFSGQLWRTNVGSNFAIGLIYSNVPPGSVFYKYNPYTGYSINTYDFGEWANPAQQFNLGDGAWFFNNSPTNFEGYFWGNITNTVTKSIAGNVYELIGTGIPKAGKISQNLGYTPNNGDVIYKWNGSFWDIHFYDFGAWNAEPNIKRSEGFFILRNGPTNWTVVR